MGVWRWCASTGQGVLAFVFLAFLQSSPVRAADPAEELGAGVERATVRVEEKGELLRLTLPECIQRALGGHPTVHEAKWDVEIRRSDLQEAKAGYYPTGDLINVAGAVNDAEGDLLSYRKFDIGERLGPFTRLEGQLAYPLFTWGRLANGVKAARKGVEQEEVNVQLKKAEVVREVKEFYYTLLYTQEVQSLMSGVQDGFQKALKTVREQRNSGKMTQVDELNLRVAYAGVAKDMAKLENGIELTRTALLRAMGLPLTSPFEAADAMLEPESAQLKNLDYYVARLFTNRPEWRQLRIGIQAKEAELQVAIGDYFPTFFLALPFRYAYAPSRSRQLNPWANDEFNVADIGPVIGLRWNLGFGQTAAKVSRTRAELMKLRTQKQTAVASFPLEVKEAYLGVREADQRMHITNDGRKAGRALVALGAANLELGIGDPEDVFIGLGQYTRAANDYYEAVRDYNIALAKLSFVVGEEVSELRY